MNVTDTNILLYVHDPRDPTEQAVAASLVQSLTDWDAMIIAACLEGGATRLYSENFDAYARIDGLEIVNPFKVP